MDLTRRFRTADILGAGRNSPQENSDEAQIRDASIHNQHRTKCTEPGLAYALEVSGKRMNGVLTGLCKPIPMPGLSCILKPSASVIPAATTRTGVASISRPSPPLVRNAEPLQRARACDLADDLAVPALIRIDRAPGNPYGHRRSQVDDLGAPGDGRPRPGCSAVARGSYEDLVVFETRVIAWIDRGGKKHHVGIMRVQCARSRVVLLPGVQRPAPSDASQAGVETDIRIIMRMFMPRRMAEWRTARSLRSRPAPAIRVAAA